MKRTSFLGVSSKKFVGLHRTIQLQLLQHYWSGHRLGLLDIEWFALETNRDYCVIFDITSLLNQKDILFIIGDWNAKVGTQETPGVTGKFGLGIRNEAGQRQ